VIFVLRSLIACLFFFFFLSLFVDEKSIIHQYLAHPQIKRRTDQEGDKWSEESYTNAVKVFVMMQQGIASDSSEESAGDTPLSYTSLRERMDHFFLAFDVFKTKAYEARVGKRYETSLPFITDHDCNRQDGMNECPPALCSSYSMFVHSSHVLPIGLRVMFIRNQKRGPRW